MVIEVNANMKLHFAINTFKWVSPRKELDHGIPHLSEYFLKTLEYSHNTAQKKHGET